MTGEVERTTSFETGMPIHQAWRDGDWMPDPLIHDDQAVVLHVRDKGLVVLTGCGHAGIVNIVRHAKQLTGIDREGKVAEGIHESTSRARHRPREMQRCVPSSSPLPDSRHQKHLSFG